MVTGLDHAGHVLVVDDNALIRTMIRDVLMAHGYGVEFAEDGQDAIVKLAWMERYPDVIVTDLLMPGIDGYELIQYLEGTERLSSIPVIIVTSLVNPPVPGGTRLVTKPIKEAELLRLVRECCELGA